MEEIKKNEEYTASTETISYVENKNFEKKHKNRFWLGFTLGLTAAIFVIAILGFGALLSFYSGKLNLYGYTKNTNPDKVVDNSATLNMDRVNKKVNLIEDIISRYFLFEENIDKVEDGIYSGLMNGLGDPYSVYYNEKDYAALTESTSGVYHGIGAVVSKNVNTGVITVIKVFENSPSKEAGMMAGDIIYKVDGIDVTGLDLDILVSTYIRGEKGSVVNITVLRGEALEQIDISVTRNTIEVPTVEKKMLNNNIGYINVSQFDEPTNEQFRKAIEELSAAGMESLIIDLRNNPGGLLDAVVDMLDYMLPNGLLVYTADKNGNGNKYYSDDNHEVKIPIVVLINENSASASEVFTGAIKDYNRGTVVGKKSFGKGIVQNVLPLGDGTAIKITTQHYYTPTGFDLHGKGIEPDIEVSMEDGGIIGESNDTQLNKAIELLTK